MIYDEHELIYLEECIQEEYEINQSNLTDQLGYEGNEYITITKKEFNSLRGNAKECQCSDEVEPQNYKNEVVLNYPFKENKTVCIDKCLEDEIRYLWSIGIETTGCCCGHHSHLPFIGVKNEYVIKMIRLGYVVQVNPCGLENLYRMDSFYPKTVIPEIEAYTNYIEHIKRHILEGGKYGGNNLKDDTVVSLQLEEKEK